ncbi:NUDIX domain-containing protein [Streptomyces sp. H10-C2]|uniref:NUDIX domain-containing protein n=1 Tax=unclassified Streptomyces TaxID=2593676 RepID=UPI0024BB8FFD|nr:MULTISPECIES: NUDIX domain-containing protein [unclassified Streptomyces]MDJ0346059.1 NUDIX domain-containing protein [Streptomyces sp. PH10-H1]MDJ0373035.1 NUDIX domain-containing protein [Streptomyces sp. H10-C2]
MPRREKDSHCTSCGTAFGPAAGWPRTCAACGATAYRNPLPVAVALLPVRRESGTGLAVIRRTIEPGRGLLALPGGFIDHGESWEQAVIRELAEETGIVAAAADVTLADVLTDEQGGYLLVFGLLPARHAAELPASVSTDETEGWDVLDAPAELAFPLHTLAVRRWFGGGYEARIRGAARGAARGPLSRANRTDPHAC